MRRDLRAGLVAQFRRVVEWFLRATVKWLWVIYSPCPGKEETAFSRDKSATFARALAVKASADEEHEDVVAALAVKAVRTTNPLLLDYINVLRELGIAYQLAHKKADAQLGALYRCGFIYVVVSKDADMYAHEGESMCCIWAWQRAEPQAGAVVRTDKQP